MDKPESGYKVINILLLESSFKRLPTIKVGAKINTQIGIEIKNNIKDNNIQCLVTVKGESFYEDKTKEAELTVSYIGFFEKMGETKLLMDNFVNINAPAIIYPFIREHISNISIKAGLKAIILPPVNFEEFAKKAKNRPKAKAKEK